jgi:hypothetical protein
MVTGIFLNFSIETLESLLLTVQTMILQGKTVITASDDGSNVGHVILTGMQTSRVLEEVNYALKKKDPDNYGQSRRMRASNYGGGIIL